VEHFDQCRVDRMQMIDPHRRIDEDHGLGGATLPRGSGRSSIGAPEECQPSGALSLDQRFETLTDQGRALDCSTQLRRLGEEAVIQRDRRSHASTLASDDALVADGAALAATKGRGACSPPLPC